MICYHVVSQWPELIHTCTSALFAPYLWRVSSLTHGLVDVRPRDRQEKKRKIKERKTEKGNLLRVRMTNEVVVEIEASDRHVVTADARTRSAPGEGVDGGEREARSTDEVLKLFV
jgi:hypothetical protein